MPEYGRVRPGGHEAAVTVTLLPGSSDGPSAGVEVEAVIDTGYTGYLTLPTEFLAEILSLPSPVDFVEVELADGSITSLGVYEVRLLWHGRPRSVTAYASVGSPLVGMSLLSGSRLQIEARPGGFVTIEEIEEWG